MKPSGLEPKPPMRPPALRLQPSAIRLAQFQRGAVIDWRQSARLLQLSTFLELFGGFVTWIETAYFPKPCGGGLVELDPLRLTHRQIRNDAEPGEIDLDRLREFLARPGEISVIETQHESSIVRRGEQEVEQSHTCIADVNAAGRRRRKTNDRSGHDQTSAGAVARDAAGQDSRARLPFAKPKTICQSEC